jgi:hypothetical protein
MNKLEFRTIDNETMYEVCLEEDGIRECCYVSSMHLVYEKEGQLRAAIKRKAYQALIEEAANNRFTA